LTVIGFLPVGSASGHAKSFVALLGAARTNDVPWRR